MADGDVDIPKVGKLPKKVLIPLAVGLAGFVAWRYWQARNGTGSDGTDSTISDGEFGAVDSSIPGVVGAVSPTNSYGSDSGNTTDNGNDPTRFTNNSQWTDYVVGKLQQSDTWTYSDIVTAIGLGLAGKPTTDAQQTILRAALAVGGQPPSGAITIVSGGNTGITVAPTGVSASQITSTTAAISFGYVPGAASYRVYRNGVQVASGSQSPIGISGMSGATTYSVAVAAVTDSGMEGPKSATISVKTAAVTLTAPKNLRVTATYQTGFGLSWSGVAGADGYIVKVNGKAVVQPWTAGTPISGLKKGTKYTISVQAVNRSATGPAATITATTKK